MRQSVLYAVIACVCSACNLGREQKAKPEPVSATSEALADPLLHRSRTLASRLGQAIARFREPVTAPAQFKAKACPDSEISARAKTARARTLVLDVQDARYEAHSLLPLRVTGPLKSTEVASLWNFFEPAPQDFEPTTPFGRRLKSEPHARAAELEVRALETQNYKGVFHITEFKKAHLIRKQGKLRREWTRGLLRAWLVVYDMDTSEALCQTPVLVSNDVENAPLSVRLAPETQRRLERELGEQMRSAAQSGMAAISRELTLPEAPENEPLPQERLTLVQPPGRQ